MCTLHCHKLLPPRAAHRMLLSLIACGGLQLRAALKQLQEVCYRRENIVSYMDRLDFASAMQDINLLLDESQR